MIIMMVQLMTAYLKILELELLMTMIWRMQLTDDDYDISQVLSLKCIVLVPLGAS